MSQRINESLSALLDNEADDLELRRVLSSIDENPELAQSWERMNLVQAVLHDVNVQNSRTVQVAAGNLSRNVAAAIASETAPQAPAPSLKLGRSAARLAIAASVALAFFMGMQTTFLQQDTVNGQLVPVASQQSNGGQNLSAALESQQQLAQTQTLRQEVDPEARQRLEDYIRSVTITREEPQQLEQLQDSPLWRLVNDIRNKQ